MSDKIQFPIALKLNDRTLTITGLAFADYHNSRHNASGEGKYIFTAHDNQGTTGHLHWDYAWHKRDTTVDELATDQPAWITPLAEYRNDNDNDFPVCYIPNSPDDNTPTPPGEYNTPECPYLIPNND